MVPENSMALGDARDEDALPHCGAMSKHDGAAKEPARDGDGDGATVTVRRCDGDGDAPPHCGRTKKHGFGVAVRGKHLASGGLRSPWREGSVAMGTPTRWPAAKQ